MSPKDCYLYTKSFHAISFVCMVLFSTLMNSQVHASNITGMGSARDQKAGRAEQKLLRYMFRDYDTDARGVVDPQSAVTVTISLLLLRIQGLDERSQVLTSTGLIICDWLDERLKWDPQEFNNITDIVIRPDRIWLPELALMNGAVELAPDFLNIRALVRYDGMVHWEPGSIFSTTCDIDIRYFPFDEQKCPLQIGAWAYYSLRMNITSADDVIQTKDFAVNGEWDIFSTKAEKKTITLPCCPDIQYPYVEFTVGLRRRYTFYMINIILPCMLLSVLVMVVFCLPPDAGEKISLGISVLLAFTVFLLMVAENIPRTSLHVPVMVIYLTCTMFLGTISVCLTVLVLNLHFRDSERPVPKWLRLLCFKYLARIMCVTGRKPKSLADLERRIDAESHNHNRGNSIKSGLRKLTKESHLLQPMMNGSTNQSHHILSHHQYDNMYDSEHSPEDTHSPHTTYTSNNSEPQQKHSHTMFSVVKRLTGKNKATGKYWHNNAYEWKEVAHILDRLFFLFVLLFMNLSFMIIVLVPLYRQPFAAAKTVDPNENT